jgi:hypothetical protein
LTPERQAAVHHALSKAIPTADVPVGLHNLSDVHVVIRFPDGTAVERLAGNIGGGCDEVAVAAAKVPSPGAILRLLERFSQHLEPKMMRTFWEQAIREDIKAGQEPCYPSVALDALAEVQKELKVFKTTVRKSATKGVGLKHAQIEIFEGDEFHILEQLALSNYLDRNAAEERAVMPAIG